LSKGGVGWDVVEGLLTAEKLVALSYDEHRFYMRKLR